jgi:hypothetical protein
MHVRDCGCVAIVKKYPFRKRGGPICIVVIFLQCSHKIPIVPSFRRLNFVSPPLSRFFPRANKEHTPYIYIGGGLSRYRELSAPFRGCAKGCGRASAPFRAAAKGRKRASASLRAPAKRRERASASLRASANGSGRASVSLRAPAKGSGRASASLRAAAKGSGRASASLRAPAKGNGRREPGRGSSNSRYRPASCRATREGVFRVARVRRASVSRREGASRFFPTAAVATNKSLPLPPV